jgi:hypothetical protein
VNLFVSGLFLLLRYGHCCGWGWAYLLFAQPRPSWSQPRQAPACLPACSLKVNKGSSSRYITSATHFNRDKRLKVGPPASGWLSRLQGRAGPGRVAVGPHAAAETIV